MTASTIMFAAPGLHGVVTFHDFPPLNLHRPPWCACYGVPMHLREDHTMDTLYAFYSQKARDQGHGVFVYENADGAEVVLTAVMLTRDGDGYGWDDKVCLGEVVRFIRTVEPAPGLPGARFL